MHIIKASAGSGKTYSLTREYLVKVLRDPSADAYRHILAVTFTNMATAEMKGRILGELHTLATRPGDSPYIGDLVPSVFGSPDAAARKARSVLVSVLHDYGGFSVSTIDSFFQRALRAFAHELGQSPSYEVELDRQVLVDETVERILDSLTETTADGRANPMLEWIVRGVKADLRSSGKFTLESRLRAIAGSVLAPDAADGVRSREDLEALADACSRIVTSFTEQVRSAADDILGVLTAAGVDPAETAYGFLKAVYKYSEATDREAVAVPTASFLNKAADPAKWFSKGKAHLADTLAPDLVPALQSFTALFGEPYKVYSTARCLAGQVYGLGLAADIRDTFDRVQRERDVITIDDSNRLVGRLVGGSDTPFIYEKMGVRYRDFLLDEFQDISSVQWENFVPLIRNAEAEGGDTLIVGDVKQSIYRWRGSDWGLLGGGVQRQFAVPDGSVSVLGTNWRSAREIVEFNNSFFPYAAAAADGILGLHGGPGSVTSLYSGSTQAVRPGCDTPGRIDVAFVKDDSAQAWQIVESVRGAIERGARPGDIAVLVRGNAEGSSVASLLVSLGYPVVSDDALHVKGSVTVRRLVSLLSVAENPAASGKGSIEGFLASTLDAAVPSRYDSLTGLAEGLLPSLRKADPELYDAEQAHLCAFMDHLHDWETRNECNLGRFLSDWDQADPKVPTPSDADAIHVLTIHKSKGLEFPLVILPFAEKISLYRNASCWRRPKVRGTALDGVADGAFQVNLAESSTHSLFSDEYADERLRQAVDNLNILYVALTRARCELKVIAQAPSKTSAQALSEGNTSAAKNLSHILFAYIASRHGGLGEDGLWSTGMPYDYASLHREAVDAPAFRLDFLPGDAGLPGIRLRVPAAEPEESALTGNGDGPSSESPS